MHVIFLKGQPRQKICEEIRARNMGAGGAWALKVGIKSRNLPNGKSETPGKETEGG